MNMQFLKFTILKCALKPKLRENYLIVVYIKRNELYSSSKKCMYLQFREWGWIKSGMIRKLMCCFTYQAFVSIPTKCVLGLETRIPSSVFISWFYCVPINFIRSQELIAWGTLLYLPASVWEYCEQLYDNIVDKL